MHDDIALIRFDRPLNHSDWGNNTRSDHQINPVCLPDETFDDEECLHVLMLNCKSI